MTDGPRPKLGLVIKSEKYWPGGTEPKGLDHYVDVSTLVTNTDRGNDR